MPHSTSTHNVPRPPFCRCAAQKTNAPHPRPSIQIPDLPVHGATSPQTTPAGSPSPNTARVPTGRSNTCHPMQKGRAHRMALHVKPLLAHTRCPVGCRPGWPPATTDRHESKCRRPQTGVRRGGAGREGHKCRKGWERPAQGRTQHGGRGSNPCCCCCCRWVLAKQLPGGRTTARQDDDAMMTIRRGGGGESHRASTPSGSARRRGWAVLCWAGWFRRGLRWAGGRFPPAGPIQII